MKYFLIQCTLVMPRKLKTALTAMCYLKSTHTVSHFSYAPLFQGPHFLTKMLESNIPYDNLFIDILSV